MIMRIQISYEFQHSKSVSQKTINFYLPITNFVKAWLPIRNDSRNFIWHNGLHFFLLMVAKAMEHYISVISNYLKKYTYIKWFISKFKKSYSIEKWRNINAMRLIKRQFLLGMQLSC